MPIGGAGNAPVNADTHAAGRRCSALMSALLSISLCTASFAATAAALADALTLSAAGSRDTPLMATPGTPLKLAVVVRQHDQGVAGQDVHWAITRGTDATLSAAISPTSAAGEDSAAGIASTEFTAHATGEFRISATVQNNPDCTGADCAHFDTVEFAITVARDSAAAATASSDEPRPRHGALIAGATGAGLALAMVANAGAQNAPKVRALSAAGGLNQSAAANAPLPNPLVVRASNDDQPAANVMIAWTASGGAVLSATSTATDASGVSQVSVTSLGPGPGPVTVTATRSDSGAAVTFTFNLLNPSLLQVSGNGQVAPTGTQAPSPLIVEARLGTATQAGIPITWSVVSGDASITVSNGGITNGAGQSSAVVNFGPTPGTVVISATRADAPAVSQTFTLTSTLTRSLSSVSGDNQTAAPNTALPSPLVVQAQDNGIAAAGITVNWSATGGATLSLASSVTDGAGNASVTVTSTGPGPNPFTVTAVRADDASAVVVFNQSVLPPVLTIVSGDAQSGLTGSAAAAPLVVLLVDGGGNPVAGQAIVWSVTSGTANLTGSSSTTDATGHASMTFSYGTTPGPITVNASAYGGSQSVDFGATALTASGLTKTSGDAQSGNPGTTVLPFVVTIVPPPGATNLSGVPVSFAITSGTGTLSVTSATTDASGQASTQLTLGLTPGAVTVLAQVSNGPSATFTATISGSLVATTLTIISGDQQTLATGAASQPMVVELSDAGTPLPGQTVTWSSSNGALSSASTVTDATGRASTTVTPSAAGPVVVTASFAAVAQYTAASTSFTHNTTIGSVASLTTDQAAVAVALDAACSQLQGAGTLTTEQQDLLNQCRALAAAGGTNPGAVANAIDELLPDVAQTQTQTGEAAVNAQFDNLKGRIATLRAGNFGSSFGGLTLNSNTGSLPLGGMFASLMDNPDTSSKPDAGFQRWGLFASGNIGRGVTDANANAPKYDFDVKGLTVGIDYRQSDKLIFGAALGYTRQATTLAGGEGSLGMHGYSLSGYATMYRANSWYADGVVTFGYNQFAHRRRIVYTLPGLTVDQVARASSSGSDNSATLTMGRDFNRKGWNLGAYGRAQYGVQGFDGFSERLSDAAAGSGLGLRIEQRTVKSLSSVLGGKASYTHSAAWGVLVPQVSLEWQREYSGDPDAFRAFLITDPTNTPILITGDALDNSYFRWNFGLSAVFPHGRSGFIQYDRIFGRDGMSQQNLSLGVRVEF